MQKTKLVSIIVPVYNTNPDYLQGCLKSLSEQTYKRIEVILVDDGSTSLATKDYLIDIKENFREMDVKVISKSNSGVNSARKRGLDIAEGTYITFVDSDDFVTPDYIYHLVSMIDKGDIKNVAIAGYRDFYEGSPEVDAIMPRTAYETQSMSATVAINWWLRYYDDTGNQPKIDLGSIYAVVIWGRLFHREFLESFNWDEFEYSLSEDEFFSTKLFTSLSSVNISNKRIYFYRRQHSLSRSEKYEPCTGGGDNQVFTYLELPVELYRYQLSIAKQSQYNFFELCRKITAYIYEVIIYRINRYIKHNDISPVDRKCISDFIDRSLRFIMISNLSHDERRLFIFGLDKYIDISRGYNRVEN